MNVFHNGRFKKADQVGSQRKRFFRLKRKKVQPEVKKVLPAPHVTPPPDLVSLEYFNASKNF